MNNWIEFHEAIYLFVLAINKRLLSSALMTAEKVVWVLALFVLQFLAFDHGRLNMLSRF